ncbi:RTA-like protein [Amylocarpus encephaloides]|uniref:RTA-like protein n=1 Tax=Amylocarpus encephaloides TaxID=45428 RepID=A0A9P7YTJ6_9HELO|nr:RTA-like protein [Amylocarpus encephaloides]
MVKSRYHYDPSTPAAVVAAACFCLGALLTTYQWLRHRSWVWVIMVVASWMEGIGYIARILSINDQTKKTLYILQFALIVLAPVLMAAGCYIIFGRIVFHVVPKESRTLKLLWISPRWLTPIFVICDIVALLLQMVGAIKITSVDATDKDAADKINQGKRIAEIGVAVQLICFGFFSIIAVRFNFTSKRFKNKFEERIALEGQSGKYVTVDGAEKKLKKNWQAILRVTNIASLCVLVRSVYRMVEFSLGPTGYTGHHEWCMYVFDALTIYPVVALFIYWFPGNYLPYLGFRLPKQAR